MTAIFPVHGASADPALCCALRRAHRLAMGRLEARYAEADLSFNQGSMLTLLRAHGALSVRELALNMSIRPVAAGRIAEGLELRGLIEADPRSTPRQPLFVLTATGRAKMDQVAAEVARRWRCIRNGLPEAEIDRLIALLDKLSDSIEANTAQAPKEA
jgi:DNA-binding MarR family transcriptional regulator